MLALPLTIVADRTAVVTGQSWLATISSGRQTEGHRRPDRLTNHGQKRYNES